MRRKDKRPIPDFDTETILSKVDFTDKCWNWTGRIDNYGYGTYGKFSHMAHRIMYKLFINDPDPNLTLDHLCRNRRCVNPAHLEQVSMRVNVLRGASFMAENANKTECKNGHEFTKENTYLHPKRGHRQCKQCRADACRRFFAKKERILNWQ